MASQLIELDKISPSAIPLIRPLKPTDSEEYRKLAASIQRDGQKSPIHVRRLTDEERATVAEGVEFGIIDGHHRYDIAKNTKGITTIEAIIQESGGNSIALDVNPNLKSYIYDVKMAFQLNDTNIPMSNIEKGAIMRQVMEVTGLKADVVGNLLFNVKSAMSYRYVQDYEKSIESQPVAQEIPAVSLPYSQKDFTVLLKSVPKSEKDIDLSNTEAAGKQLHAIRKLEEQLKALKKILSASDDAKKAANQLGVEERRKNKENSLSTLIDAAKDKFKQKNLQFWEKGKQFEELRNSTKITKAELMEKLGVTPSEVEMWTRSLKEYNQFMKALEAKKAEIDASEPLDNLEKADIIMRFDNWGNAFGIKSVGDMIFGKKNWPEDYRNIYDKHFQQRFSPNNTVK